MDNEIKVSVMMVTYNQEKYIDEAIRSVVSQKFDHPYEVIIGDDCSTDKTLEICLKWRDKYPDIIKVIERSENVGIQRNYIDTYNHCRGQYLAICEGDDFWCSKHKLQRQVDYMDSHDDCAICFHRVVNYYMADGSKSLSNGGTARVDSDIHDLAKSNYITNLSVMYRKSAIQGLPDWLSEIDSPDYVIHMLHASAGKIHYINRPMAVYRQHANGIWGSNIKEKQFLISINSRKRLIEHFSSTPSVASDLIKSYTVISLSLALHYDEIGETAKSKALKIDILKYNPTWTTLTLEAQLQKRKRELLSGTKKPVKRLLTKCRVVVSRFIPLPRIKK